MTRPWRKILCAVAGTALVGSVTLAASMAYADNPACAATAGYKCIALSNLSSNIYSVYFSNYEEKVGTLIASNIGGCHQVYPGQRTYFPNVFVKNNSDVTISGYYDSTTCEIDAVPTIYSNGRHLVPGDDGLWYVYLDIG